MNALRLKLGTSGVVFGGKFVFLAIMGNAFRKSLGASDNGPQILVLPVLGITLLLAAIFFPPSKPLLHLAAASALGFLGFFLWQFFKEGEAPFWFAITDLAAWLVYYWIAAWRAVSPP